MDSTPERKIIRINQGQRETTTRRVVEEYPLNLRVNDRELATLICSPHQLNFLVAGFFYLQGFITSLDDILIMGICTADAQAELRIRGEIPERMQTTLTSGCGTGISFNLPTDLLQSSPPPMRSYSSEALIRTMHDLQQQAEQYRRHGGIHSAAIGDADGLQLYAEDIGRHNTLDRLAGQALFKQLDLRGKLLVTSGRISSEMVAKAARLGIGLMASRTSPTDKAIELCEQAGITLVGYLRGQNMEIYSHPQQLRLSTG